MIHQEQKWIIVDKFTGFKTKQDAEKIDDGANANGQNTTVNDGDRISARNLGYEVFGDLSEFSTTDPITSVHTFRRRDGTNILMASFGTYLCYYNRSSSTWESLKTDYTSNKRFGFADYNIGTDLISWCYFGNAYDDWARWRGRYAKLTSAVSIGNTTIYVDSTTGWSASGNVIINGVSHAYSSVTATSIVLTGTATVNFANGRGVAEAIDSRSGATYPKGNIYLIANNRLFIAGNTDQPQAVYFSKYGDATDFSSTSLVTGSTTTASGVFNLGEGGGGVTDMVLEEGSIYLFKNSIVYKATLTDSLYTLLPLKPFDSRSQTMGALAGTVFTGDNFVFLITPDGQFLSLQRVEYIDYPQAVAISDVIKPTINACLNDKARGIVFKNKAFFSTKQDKTVNGNNAIFVWDLKNNLWDSPITGFNASDFVIYKDSDEDELYFGDSTSTIVNKINYIPTDGVDMDNDISYDVAANWRSKQFTFGAPQSLKECSNIFIEGYIADNTSLTVTLLVDDNGFIQSLSTSISGKDNNILFNTPSYNPFGLNAFGFERFGSNDDLSGKKKFRIYLNKDIKIKSFYNLQLDFFSSGQNQQWEITQFGFKVGISPQEVKTGLIKSFK